jgi:acetyl-CoA acetyltransferase
MNPNGGSIALGHPFGAAVARILSQAVKEVAPDQPGSGRWPASARMAAKGRLFFCKRRNASELSSG